MPAMTIEQMRDVAQQNLEEAEARLTQLRTERDNLRDAIKATLAERDDAKRIVSKLAPPKPRTKPAVVDLADDTVEEPTDIEETQ